MKDSTLATKVIIAILCLGVAVYLTVYFVRGWDDGLVTAVAYAYAQDVGVEAPSLVVREETVLPAADGYVDQILAEGERAAVGDAVALLYSDASALTTRQSIRALEAEIEQLEYAQSAGTQSGDGARLDGQIISSVAGLRSLTASGSLSALEEYALNLRVMVFRRDYAYGETGAAAQFNQLIADKRSELSELSRSLSQVSRTVYAPVSGVFSGEVDGWETVAAPDMLPSLTIEGLSQLLSRKAVPDTQAVGKLISGSTWYLAVLLPGTDTGLQEGRSYPVSFSDGYYDQISMTLERIELGDSQTLAVFAARSHLADTTLLRDQTGRSRASASPGRPCGWRRRRWRASRTKTAKPPPGRSIITAYIPSPGPRRSGRRWRCCTRRTATTSSGPPTRRRPPACGLETRSSSTPPASTTERSCAERSAEKRTARKLGTERGRAQGRGAPRRPGRAAVKATERPGRFAA